MNSVKYGPFKKNLIKNWEIEIKNPPINPNNFNNKTYKSICILR